MTIRVGVDAHILSGKHQGSKTLLIRLLTAVARQHKEEDFILYCHDVDVAKGVLGGGKFQYEKIANGRALGRLFLEFPRILKRDRVDVAYFQYIAPFCRGKKVIAVHDILAISHPRLFPLLFVIRSFVFFSLSILSSSAIITISEASRRDIVRYFPTRSNRVHMVPCGPSFEEAVYFKGPAGVSSANNGRPYILTVGRIEKRKNAHMLAEAFLRAGLDDIDLVIVGNFDQGFKWNVPLTPSIKVLNGIGDEALIELYRGASLFVYPSVAEGFGIPLLDAILFGIPTLASDRTSMPEVGRDLVEYFNPEGPDAISVLEKRIAGHFRGHPIHAPTAAQRKEHMALFSWDVIAARTLEILNSV